MLFGNRDAPMVPAPSPPSTAPSTTPSTATDLCGFDELSKSGWLQVPAEIGHPENVNWDDPGEGPAVFDRVGPGDAPEVSVRLRLRAGVTAGNVLYVVRRPDGSTRDQEGNRENGNYYPIAEFTPDRNGCWENQGPSSYPGSRGIAEIYYLVVTDRAQADKFDVLSKKDNWNGILQEDWNSLPVSKAVVAKFEVQTD